MSVSMVLTAYLNHHKLPSKCVGLFSISNRFDFVVSGAVWLNVAYKYGQNYGQNLSWLLLFLATLISIVI